MRPGHARACLTARLTAHLPACLPALWPATAPPHLPGLMELPEDDVRDASCRACTGPRYLLNQVRAAGRGAGLCQARPTKLWMRGREGKGGRGGRGGKAEAWVMLSAV